uniref:Arf-GAP domain-containing protein n=1 Tax=Spumella elongata TaxID=89044 RepID=A0A7S3H7N3_9STRA|mmetsp:Transcript_37111/g.64082  ORF Transcript_37111/g.64082 Transcript_37111/m.64082 type:complete len:461 (+) Transcript_37111:42-1424(+)|eukprot:CAMPEP_0184968670 /NCGR_PEP_ID=MMETSP1098-20130426/1642_1 /TAXON_ID=89044 /ORGANISM="Spumella elongata, Strain CCAP 955/1" /LENGTH=460 /DNA_ID=CAMNT_0027490315 /DNA_START=35 /DNA_END=1417 /DNA_ORIENTATION=+
MAAPADQVKLRKRLEVLLKQPDNQVCADCNKRGPRWASANLGIFFCIECSGIHRNLGVHISFVRSVNLDSWTNKQVEFMEEWGNGRANAYWEANLPPHIHKPKEGDSVRTIEKFIRDKYEHKRYVASSVPERGATASAAPAPAVETTRTESNKSPVRGFVYDDEPVREEKFTAATRRTAPAAAAAPVAKPAAAVDLLNFMDEPAAPSPAAVASNGGSPFAPTAASTVFGFEAAAAPQQQSDFFGNDFSAFQSAPTAPHHVQHAQQQPVQVNNTFGFDNFAPTAANRQHPHVQATHALQHTQHTQQQPVHVNSSFGFDNFGPQDSLNAPVPMPAAPAAASARPQASADSILSLFAAPVPQQQNYGHQQFPQGGYSPHGAPAYPPQGFYPPQQQGFGQPMNGYGQAPAAPFNNGYAQPQGFPQQGFPQQGFPAHQPPMQQHHQQHQQHHQQQQQQHHQPTWH